MVVVAGVFVPDGWAPVPDLAALAQAWEKIFGTRLRTDARSVAIEGPGAAVRFLEPEAFRRRSGPAGGAAVSAAGESDLAALRLAVRDLGAATEVLRRHEVPFHALEGGTIGVAPEHACGAVRLVHDWDLLVFENALNCMTYPAHAAGHWAYQLARDYAERYNPAVLVDVATLTGATGIDGIGASAGSLGCCRGWTQKFALARPTAFQGPAPAPNRRSGRRRGRWRSTGRARGRSADNG